MEHEPEDTSVSQRVATHRTNLRNEGLKPLQLWVPDLAQASVLEALERACQAVEAYPESRDDAEFAYALSQDEA